LISTAATLSGSGSPAAISDADRRRLVSSIAQCVANGMIEPTSAPDSFVTTLSERPQASRLARVEALTSKVVTNRRHEPRMLGDDAQNIIKYLDGEHDREALLRELMATFDRGDLSILIGGIPATGEQAVSDTLRNTLDRCLKKLALDALLVA
jgi:PKMT, C-terminal winged helix domain